MRTAPPTLLILALTATYTSTLAAQSSPPDFLVEFGEHFNASADKVVALAMAMPGGELHLESDGGRGVGGKRLHAYRTLQLLLSGRRLGRALARGRC